MAGVVGGFKCDSFYFLVISEFQLAFKKKKMVNLSSDTGQNKTWAWSSAIFVPLWKVFSQLEPVL